MKLKGEGDKYCRKCKSENDYIVNLMSSLMH